MRTPDCHMSPDGSASATDDAVRGLIVGANSVRFWGMSSAERLRRCFALAGIDAAGPSTAPEPGSASPRGRVVIASDNWVFDAALIRGLAARTTDTALVEAASGAVAAINVDAASAAQALATLDRPGADPGLAGIAMLSPAELGSSYNRALRKHDPPYLLRLTPETLPAIEARMFGASYKGVTDVVTKYLWPRPARFVTRLCAELGVTPNQVTLASLLLVFLSFWAFWNGHYSGGLVSAWLMTFLDTVDGKLARVTLTSSKLGGAFDHGIDLVHPPFWWWAWIVGLPAYGTALAQADAILVVILIGYVVQRLVEGTFELLFGMHVHVWRRFDSRFRLWTARRNPNLLILTPAALFARPDIGIWLVAAWTAISLAVHAVQLVQALLAGRRGRLESWLDA